MAKHTLDEITTVVQFIFENLADKPELLESEGIFRQSGSKTKIEELIEKILNQESFANTRYGPHDYIGALKYLLKDSLVINLQDERIQPLLADLSKLELNEDNSVQNTIASFNTYLDDLARSQNRNDIILAHALYSYCHFAQEATQYSIKNKMHAANIGIILGPLFQHHLMFEADFLTFSPKFNGLFERMIAENNFEEPFEMKYPSQILAVNRQLLKETLQEILSVQSHLADLNERLTTHSVYPLKYQGDIEQLTNKHEALEEKLRILQSAERSLQSKLKLSEDLLPFIPNLVTDNSTTPNISGSPSSSLQNSPKRVISEMDAEDEDDSADRKKTKKKRRKKKR